MIQNNHNSLWKSIPQSLEILPLLSQHLLLDILLELVGVKFVVVPPTLHQLTVRSSLDNPSVLDHQNCVGVPYRGKAVGYDKAGSAFQQGLDGLLKEHFHLGVNGAGRLVEDEDAWVGKDGTGEGD